MYRRNDVDGWVFLVVIVLAVLGVALYWIIRFGVAAATEGVRIYVRHGRGSSRVARILQGVLIGFVILVTVCILAGLAFPMTSLVDTAVACWGFFISALVVSACGWNERTQHSPDAIGDLDTYLDFTRGSHQAEASPSTPLHSSEAVAQIG